MYPSDTRLVFHRGRAAIIVYRLLSLVAAGALVLLPLVLVLNSTLHFHCADFALDAISLTALLRSGLMAITGALIGSFLVAVTYPLVYPLSARSLLVLAPYVINPISRGLAYQHLFLISTPIDRLSSSLFGDFVSTGILLPAAVQALNYLPVGLCLRAAASALSQSVHVGSLDPFERWVLVAAPRTFTRIPFQLAFLFLLGLFDYWIVQVIAGNRINYYAPLLVQRALKARELPRAASMLLQGLSAALGVYLLCHLVQSVLARSWRRISPLALRSFLPSLHNAWQPCAFMLRAVVVALVLWPVVMLFVNSLPAILRSRFSLPVGLLDALIATLVISTAVALFATAASLLVVCIDGEFSTWRRFFTVPAVILALAPEGLFVPPLVLLALYTPVRPGLPALLLTMLSYSVPIGGFLWTALNGGHPPAALRPVGAATRANVTWPLLLTLWQYRRAAAGVFGLTFWLAADNVLLASFLGGPIWTTASARFFATARRGFSPAEHAGALLSAASAAAVVCTACGVSYLVLKRVTQNERRLYL